MYSLFPPEPVRGKIWELSEETQKFITDGAFGLQVYGGLSQLPKCTSISLEFTRSYVGRKLDVAFDDIDPCLLVRPAYMDISDAFIELHGLLAVAEDLNIEELIVEHNYRAFVDVEQLAVAIPPRHSPCSGLCNLKVLKVRLTDKTSHDLGDIQPTPEAIKRAKERGQAFENLMKSMPNVEVLHLDLHASDSTAWTITNYGPYIRELVLEEPTPLMQLECGGPQSFAESLKRSPNLAVLRFPILTVEMGRWPWESLVDQTAFLLEHLAQVESLRKVELGDALVWGEPLCLIEGCTLGSRYRAKPKTWVSEDPQRDLLRWASLAHTHLYKPGERA